MGIPGLLIPFQRIAETTRDLRDLEAAMVALTPQLGFRYFAIASHVDPATHAGAIRLHNYPPGWADRYDREDFGVIDPVHRRSHLVANGFWWWQMDEIELLTSSERRMLAWGEEQGIGNGFTISAHLPGEPGTCTFANPLGQPAYPHQDFLARLAGLAAFEAARRLAPKRSRQNLALRPVITRQQRIILQLLSEGKSNFEISLILNISEKTVGSHVRDLFARYGVNKRTLLISRAWQDGYVTRPD